MDVVLDESGDDDFGVFAEATDVGTGNGASRSIIGPLSLAKSF